MSIVVTGGTGFVGLALAEALLQAGREVALFAYAPMPEGFRAGLGGASFTRGDVTSASDLEQLFDTEEPEAVVHLAAVTPDRDAEMADPSKIVDVNVGGTANLLRAASRLRRRPRILLASSVAVYGETPPVGTAYKEADDAPRPHSLYGITKLAAETVALRLAALYDIDLTIVRLGPVYGPWEYKTGLRPLLSPHAQVVDLWRRGERVILPRQLVGDWLYSRDAGRGLAALLSAGRLPHAIYNLGGNTASTLAEWCENLETVPWSRGWRIAGNAEKPNVIFGLAEDRAALDIERIATDTGFRPSFDSYSAAKDYLSWLAMVSI